MVTLAYLRSLPPPRTGAEFNRDMLRNALHAAILLEIPEWDPRERGPIARVLEPIIESIWMAGELAAMQSYRYLLAYVQGEDAIVRAADSGIIPLVGESLDGLVERVATSPVRNAPGFLVSVIDKMINHPTLEVVEATSWVPNDKNRYEIDGYFLKMNNGIPTSEELTLMQDYMNDGGNLHMGVNMTVKEPILTQIAVTAEMTYRPSEINPDLLRTTMRTRLEAYFDSLRLGEGMYKNDLYEALNVPSGRDLTISKPTGSMNAVYSTKYILDKDAADIQLKAVQVDDEDMKVTS